MQLGNLQMKLGLCEEASSTFKLSLSNFSIVNKDKIQQLIKSSSECARKISDINKLSVRRNYNEAIRLLDTVLETTTSATHLRIKLCHLLLETKQWERLVQISGSILRVRPDDSEVLYLRGWGLLMNGDKDTAQTHFRKVVNHYMINIIHSVYVEILKIRSVKKVVSIFERLASISIE